MAAVLSKILCRPILLFRRLCSSSRLSLHTAPLHPPLSSNNQHNLHHPMATMKSVLVHTFGSPPSATDVPIPPLPTDSSTIQVKVIAAGVHQLVRSRASGKHYSASTKLPYNAGYDAVGRTTDGKLVYLTTLSSGQGTFSELLNVPQSAVTELDETADVVQVAAMTNPVMSSWMALRTRATNLPEGFTVVIMGVTSASGRAAVEVARLLGAGKVIGVARNPNTMNDIPLDETIVLQKDVKATDFSAVNEADVILDYLYGEPAECMLNSLKITKRVQWISIGVLAGPNLSFPSAALRSSKLVVLGSGIGAWTVEELEAETPAMLKAVQALSKQKIRVARFEDAEVAWNEPGDRLVLVIGATVL